MHYLGFPSCRPALFAAIIAAGPVHAAVIDWVLVGDPGNPADDRIMTDDTTGYGSVGYHYNIGKYEVTNSQYAEFLNAVAQTDTHELYSTEMGSEEERGGIDRSGTDGSYTYTVKPDMGNKPVNHVTWYDAARFTNWLHNSQPSGLQTTLTTEDGAYTLSGNSGLIEKNSSATVWIPTEDEWYKAAYYNPTAGDYWFYPTQSDSVPTLALATATGDVSNPGPNVANYAAGADWGGRDGNLITVGSTGSASPYGTFDQGGNVAEWNDLITGAARGQRGGDYEFENEEGLQASSRGFESPGDDYYIIGFRVAGSAPVPEPGTAVFALLAGGLALRRRRITAGHVPSIP